MTIDYLAEANKYRPDTIKTLLVGEAPPHNGTSYFYVPKNLKKGITIRKDHSMSATIFYPYFGRISDSEEEYVAFLLRLKEMGIFLIDIHDEPIQIRDYQTNTIIPENIATIQKAIPDLKNKLINLNINIPESQITFLLPKRGVDSYKKDIQLAYPDAEIISCYKFRMNRANIVKN